MSESVLVVTSLADADAVAVRSGDDVLIQVSPTVPVWARDAIVADLNRAVSLAPPGPVRVSLPVGAAVELAAQPIETLSPSREPNPALHATAAAAFVLPIFSWDDAQLDGSVPELIQDSVGELLCEIDVGDWLVDWALEVI